MIYVEASKMHENINESRRETSAVSNADLKSAKQFSHLLSPIPEDVESLKCRSQFGAMSKPLMLQPRMPEMMKPTEQKRSAQMKQFGTLGSMESIRKPYSLFPGTRQDEKSYKINANSSIPQSIANSITTMQACSFIASHMREAKRIIFYDQSDWKARDCKACLCLNPTRNKQ